MQKSIRQSMAWLHSWTGLIFGWLLFAIFIMGAVSYYRHEISIWMQPQFATHHIDQQQAIKSAYGYLQENAPDARRWYIGVANNKNPVNEIFWEKAQGGFERKVLDPNLGTEVKRSFTQGGDFFYNFHFQLYGMPIMVGRMITTLAAFIMLIALISGIITHKKIITDFFTLRAFKGQRSYLDFHNVTSVIAIPFFLTITFTGIAIFFYVYLPWGMKTTYPTNPFQYFEEIRFGKFPETPNSPKAEMKPVQYFLDQTQYKWGDTDIDNVMIRNPNTTSALFILTEAKDHSITHDKAQLTFNGIDGNILGNTRNNSAVAKLSYSMYGLHMATFAKPFLRLMFFFSGILGSLMIASGLLLWSLKRQIQNKQQKFHFGHYLVNRLNVATFVGLPVAMLSYLYANRIVELEPKGPNYEIYTFFFVWLLSFIFALLTKQNALWKLQLKLFIVIGSLLPLFNLFTLIQNQYISNIQEYWVFFRIDLMIILFVFGAFFVHQKIEPIQTKAVNKITNKLRQKEIQESI